MPNEYEQLPTRSNVPKPLMQILGPLIASLVEGSLSERQNAAQILALHIGALEQRIDGLERRIDGLTEMYFGRQEDDMNESLILNISQVARALGVSRPTVYRLIENGILPAKRLATGPDTGPRTVVLSEDLRTYLVNLPSAEGQPA